MSKDSSNKEAIENNSDDLELKSDPLANTEDFIEVSIVTAAGTAAAVAAISSVVPVLLAVTGPVGWAAAAGAGIFILARNRDKRKKLKEEQKSEK